MHYQNETNYIIYLLKCAIEKETPKTPDTTIDWNIIYQLAKKHKIIPILCFAIIKLPKDYIQTILHMESYMLMYKQNLVLDANRSYETERLKSVFNSQKIDFILLKGSFIKHYYPDTFMRRMSDIDILFRGTDFKTLDTIFENLGYKILQKGAKDTAYINPVNNIKIEMQPHLIDMGYSEWYEYLQDIWEKCSNDKHEYKMNLEDFYIYHIIHMAKHFKNGGIGLNHILDIYVMNLTFKPMDWSYIENELLKINLYKFNQTMQALVRYWFNNKNTINFSKEDMEMIAEYVFAGGAFGTKKQQETNHIVTRGDHKLSYRKKVFPNSTIMINYYGAFLKKHKYFLPLYWIRLNFTRLLNYNKKTKQSIHHMSSITESNISKTEKIFHICGLS